LPFIAGNAEQNSVAAWEYYQKHLQDEFKDVKVLAVHTHGPGLIHAKGNGVQKLEDLKGLKVRAPTRIINELLKVRVRLRSACPCRKCRKHSRAASSTARWFRGK
jgi:TRAP-type transport system periplasmic protein